MSEPVQPLNLGEQPKVPTPPPATVSISERPKMVQPEGLAIDVYFSPERLNAMISFARQLIQSKAAIGGIQNEFQALAIMQTGAEMGIPPMEALGAFYIVNGKIVMYGAAMTKQLRRHGYTIEYLDETPGEKVTIRLTHGEQVMSYTADKNDPVLKKSRAMTIDPYSKLRWHAMARCLRFQAAEVMGPVQYLAEEFDDVIVVKEAEGKAETPKPRAVKKAFETTITNVNDAPTTVVASDSGAEVTASKDPSTGWETTEEPRPAAPLAPLDL